MQNMKISRTEIENDVASKLCDDKCMECKSCKVYGGTCKMFKLMVEELVNFCKQGGVFIDD